MIHLILARFARKPADLAELRALLEYARPEPFVVQLRQDLTEAQYDAFADSLLLDREWLRDRGGYDEDGRRFVVEVIAPNRETLYVDPSGSAYGRYVGMRVD